MTSPPKRRARSTATRLLPTAVGPRTMTRTGASGSNFDEDPDREERDEDEEGEELAPFHGASPSFSRLRTREDSCSGPSVRLTTRTSAARISSMLRSMDLRQSSPTMFALTRSRDLSSRRPSGLSSALRKAGSRRSRTSSRAFPIMLHATGPPSFEMYLKTKAHRALHRPRMRSMPASERSPASLAVFGFGP